jgi:hypothetical protein
MLTVLALLSLAPLAAPTEPLAKQLRAAIWYDLEVNALIGNGNWAGSLWYNAGSDALRAADLHIQDLACRSHSKGHRCSFTLFRDGGVVTILGEKAADKLTCDATLIEAKDNAGWAVKHIPPRRAGHSRTTMRCKPVAA